MEVIRESDFTVDSIFEKRLYFLIPFYIFNYEKELADINADADRTEAMVGLYRDIMARIDEEQARGRLSSLSYSVIIRLTHKVIFKFLMKHSNVREKVGDFMGGKLLDLPELRLYHKGKADGKKENEAEIKKLQSENKKYQLENDRLRAEVERLKSAKAN